MAENAKTTLEERMARVEGILEQMNERLNHLENTVNGLRGEINGLRGELAQLRAEFHTDFRWLIGFVVGTWITLMLTLIFKG